MKKIKTIIDREPLGSDYIASRQNFDQVIQQASQLSVPTWKSAWFYGPIGMAVIAVTVSVVTIDPASADASVTTASMDKVTPSENEGEKMILASDAQEDKANPVGAETEPVLEQVSHTNHAVQQPQANPRVETQPEPEPIVETTTPLAEETNAPSRNKGAFAHIGQYYMGEIPVSALDQALECNDEIRIIAFNVHFNTLNGTETAPIIGNKIPAKIIEAIKQHNIGYMITFTDIKGKTAEGKVVSLLPMNFIATKLK